MAFSDKVRGKLHKFKNLVAEGGEKNVANTIKNLEIPTFKGNSTPEKFSAFDTETAKWKAEQAPIWLPRKRLRITLMRQKPYKKKNMF